VSAVDAFGPGVRATSHTFDRLLVSGDQVMVLGTDGFGSDDYVWVGVFHLPPDGRLAHRATYRLRSVDSYRRSLYASRTDAVHLVGNRLVFYVPLPAEPRNPLAGFPAVMGPGVVSSPAAAVRVYRPAGRVSGLNLHLHALTSCDLADGPPRCESTALLADGDRPFHVTPTAVYLWATQREWDETLPGRSVLYRIPLDGSTPTALRVAGKPVDEHSIVERDGHVHAFLRMDAAWRGAEWPSGRLALLRVPVSALGAGRDAATDAHYRALPGTWGPLNHRFVGDWLVYAITDSPVGGSSSVYAVRLAGGGGESQVAVLPYRLDFVEAMGPDAAVVGSNRDDLELGVVRLGPEAATLAHHQNLGSRRLRPGGLQYRPDGEGAGVLGLPLYGPHRPGYEHLQLGSASILFLRSQDHRLSEIGELASGEPTGNDDCVASCGLWYGNARTLFLRGRVLALLGFELVEGRDEGGRILESRRVRFAPTVPTAAVAGAWEFTETIGYPVGQRYRCTNRGTMWLDPAGPGALRMRYRQTGECTVEGATTPSDGEGSGTGTLGPDGLTLDSNGCRYRAVMLNADELRAFISCRIPMPDGTPLDVEGQLEARRARR
ncbi:MAG TPA: hypothetical protein VFX98_01690, partial [Longimicrobiaceae bacterium]|nr:hypothetical protein [Longimicrobiaceae bacterium]